MELETATRKHLLQQKGVTNLTGRGADARVYKFILEEPLEGTGKVALVVFRSGAWSAPIRRSQEYPLLVVDCYADNSRDEDENKVIDDRNDRAYQLYREVDRVLHQVNHFARRWPTDDEDGLMVIGCHRGSEPTPPVENAGVAMVRVTYDVIVVHDG